MRLALPPEEIIRATVIADSISPAGERLTTFELVAPKRIVAQFNTHGMIRRDSASIRAVPTVVILQQILDQPYRPAFWRYKQKGMQPGDFMSPSHQYRMNEIEDEMRQAIITGVAEMAELGASKEDINAYLEPWMYTTIVATATEWDNYYRQRAHEDAQGAHSILAYKMREAQAASEPVLRSQKASVRTVDIWHLPYVTDEERQTGAWTALVYASAARCAGISYFRQGKREDRTIDQEIMRTLDLVRAGHWSPTEMPARVGVPDEWYGPYRGWKSLRKFYAGESGSDHHGTQKDALWVLR